MAEDMKIWVLLGKEDDDAQYAEYAYFQSEASARAAGERELASDSTFDDKDYEDGYEEWRVKEIMGIPSLRTPVYDRGKTKWVPRRYGSFDHGWQIDLTRQTLMILNLHRGIYEPAGYKIEQHGRFSDVAVHRPAGTRGDAALPRAPARRCGGTERPHPPAQAAGVLASCRDARQRHRVRVPAVRPAGTMD